MSRATTPVTKRWNAATFTAILLPFTAIALFQYWHFPSRQRDVMWTALEQKAIAISELAAYDARPGLEFEDRELVSEVFRGAARDDDLLFIAVHTADGKLFVTKNRTRRSPVHRGTPRRTKLSRRTDRVEVVTPVSLGVGSNATLSAGFSARDLLRESRQNETVALAIGLAIFGIGLFTALWASTAMRRIQKLAEEAQAASRAKSEFLANMSHEIRTPINGVFGMTALLLNTQLTERQKRFIEQIRRSSDALLQIINDILDFSKVEAGKLVLEEVDFDLVQKIEEVTETFVGQAHQKGIELICHVQPDVPSAVRGDPLRFQQVLTNLIGNALKFTNQGHVAVRAKLVRSDSTSTEVRVEVQDTGVGIPEETRAKLFKAFSQADTSTTRKYGGTGLGLVISKRLVEIMGGEIGVSSTIGEGSTFHFTIRFGHAQQLERRVPVESAVPLVGKRVLVVDDNETNRVIVSEIFRSWSLVTEEAGDGKQALEKLHEAERRGEPFDIAVLDYHMPEMDGLELATAIRDDEALKPVRMVLLASLAGGESDAFRHAGVHAHLTKPVRRSLLLECVQRLLNGDERSRTPTPFPTTPREAHASATGPLLLVAEDNPTNQEVISGVLDLLGYRAEIVDNGRLALENAIQRHGSFAAVLMDCQMPEMDGYEAATRVREEERRNQLSRLPIIAVTAHALAGDREKVLAAGMDDYVTKPVQLDMLRDVLAKWAKGVGQEAAVTPSSVSVAETRGPVLDPRVLTSLKRLCTPRRPNFLRDVVATYTSDSGRLLEALATAVHDRNAVDIRTHAHTLKGSSRNIGAARVASLAETLQNLGESGSLEGAEALIDELRRELDAAWPELRAFAGTGPRYSAAPPSGLS